MPKDLGPFAATKAYKLTRSQIYLRLMRVGGSGARGRMRESKGKLKRGPQSELTFLDPKFVCLSACVFIFIFPLSNLSFPFSLPLFFLIHFIFKAVLLFKGNGQQAAANTQGLALYRFVRCLYFEKHV